MSKGYIEVAEKKILIVGKQSYSSALDALGEISTDIDDFKDNASDYSLVMFTGGEDVHPSMYNDISPRNLCNSNLARDRKEMVIFHHALTHNIKMTGICRGCQFINVMSGGRLMHHIDHHEGGNHLMQTSRVEKPVLVNSYHHQMVIPPKYAYIIGWSKSRLSKEYIGRNDKKVEWPGPEIEAIWIPNTKCCGVQYHPEWMTKESSGYLFYWQMLYELLTDSEEVFTRKYSRGAINGEEQATLYSYNSSNS